MPKFDFYSFVSRTVPRIIKRALIIHSGPEMDFHMRSMVDIDTKFMVFKFQKIAVSTLTQIFIKIVILSGIWKNRKFTEFTLSMIWFRIF